MPGKRCSKSAIEMCMLRLDSLACRMDAVGTMVAIILYGNKGEDGYAPHWQWRDQVAVNYNQWSHHDLHTSEKFSQGEHIPGSIADNLQVSSGIDKFKGADSLLVFSGIDNFKGGDLAHPCLDTHACIIATRVCRHRWTQDANMP